MTASGSKSSPPPKQKPPTEALVEFVQYNMTVAEANRFLRLVTRHYGHEFRPEKKPWQSIRAFFHANVAAADTVRYLRELERRKREGEQLIR